MKKYETITILSLLLFIACIFTSACGSGGGSSCGTQYVPIANETQSNNQTNNIPTNNTPEPDLDNTIVTDNSKTITFSKNLFNLNIGETEKIVVYVDGEDKTSDVTISLKDENVKKSAVALVENGTITALKAGSAVFKVSYEGINDNYFTVTVNDPELPNITVSKSEIDFTLGETDSENITVYLNEEDVTSQAKFTSSDESIATIDESGNITAISEGTTIIIVHVDGSNDAQVTVNVYDPNNHTITTDFDNVELYLGHNKNIKVTVGGKTPNNATFTSNDESIATVDENGKITAIGEGNTEITVQVDNIEETKTINVVSKNSVTLGVLDTENINLTDNSGITYTSEDESIVNVDENGNLTAKDIAGNTNITVQAEGIEDKTITVTVNDDSQEVTLNDTVLNQLGYTKVAYSNFYDLKKNGEIVDSLEIPAVYKYEGNKYKITAIGNRAFYRCTSITRNITLPDTVTNIESEAFYDCSLKDINIPNNVTNIKDETFSGCTNLNVTLHDNITNFGTNAFYQVKNLTYNLDKYPNSKGWGAYGITITNGVTSIPNNAFYDCSSLRNINIPNSVTTIGNYAFYECSSLKNINIPNSVTTIGYDAFYDCFLLNVTIPDNITNIGSQAFYGVKNLTYNLDKYSTSKGWGAYGITITNGVTTIPNSAFASNYYWNATPLKKITLPNSVTNIESQAFYNCSNLTEINIPDNVTNIGSQAFYDCYNLTNITIPDSVTSIGSQAFYSCSSLKTTIPDNVTNIESNAFSYVKNITYNLDKYPTSKGWGASGVTIADGTISIPDNAFYDCYLTNITIPDSVTSIGNYAFYDCYLTNVTIPNSVISIGDYAFYDCYNLTSIIIPDSVTSIGNKAFAYCYNLRSVTINGNNLQTIGEEAFYYCGNNSGLTLTIPNSVTSIGYEAFYNSVKFYYNGSATGSPWGGTYLGTNP